MTDSSLLTRSEHDGPRRHFIRFGEIPDGNKSTLWRAPNHFFQGEIGRKLPGLSVYEVRKDGDRWELLTDEINLGSGMASLLELFGRAEEDSSAKIYLLEGTANCWSTLSEEDKAAHEDAWLGKGYDDHDLLGTDGEPLLGSFEVIGMLSLRDLVCKMISYPEDWEDDTQPGGFPAR